MSDEIKKLRKEWQDAEKEAVALVAEKDRAMGKYRERCQDANDHAAELQKKYLDAEATQALVGRDDAETVAEALGLTLPE